MDTTNIFQMQKPSVGKGEKQSDLINAVSTNATICDTQLGRLSTAVRCYGDPTQNGMIAFYPSDNNIYAMPRDSFIFRNYTSSSTVNVPCNIGIIGDLNVSGKLVVQSGVKQRVVETKDYGTRGMNAYETPSPMFGDMEYGTIKDGKCIIKLDKIFNETINTDIDYYVFVSPNGNGNVWVNRDDMHKDYFIVSGNSDIDFTYEIKAKQLGFEDMRLNEVHIDNKFKETQFDDDGNPINPIK